MQTRVLIVEDHDRTRLALSALMRQAGYHVRAVDGGAAALGVLASEPFDVVLSDIWMDQIDGVAVLRAARALDEPPAVILLTGSSSVETSVAALRSGAFDYLEKPFDPAALVARVASAAEQRAAELRDRAALQMLARAAELMRLSAEAPLPPTVASLQPSAPLCVGRLQVGVDRRTVRLDGARLPLTQIEFALLRALAEAAGRAVSVEELVRRTHGYALPPAEALALLKPHASNLRRKLPDGYLGPALDAAYRLAPPAASDGEATG
jgi:DNA-binding response OmpR family regulator